MRALMFGIHHLKVAPRETKVFFALQRKAENCVAAAHQALFAVRVGVELKLVL